MMKATVTMIAVLLALILPQFALSQKLGPGQEIVTLDTRRGVTMRVFLAKPKADLKGTFFYFKGGIGGLEGQRSGRIGEWVLRGGSTEQGFLYVQVSEPSDQTLPLSYDYRTSSDQIKDIKKVIEFISQKWPGPIFLIGHSRGTVSVADLAAELKDNRIRGVVLAGSLAKRLRRRVRLKKITVPVLLVHHKDDGCTNIEPVRKLRKRFKKSPKVDFIEVVGGNSPPESDPCRGGQNPHSFRGQDKEVLKAVVDWATGKPIPAQIGP